MRRQKKIFLFSFLSVLFLGSFLFLSFAFAQGDLFGLQPVDDTIGLGGQDIRLTIARIIRALLGLLGIIAVGIMLYGGFVYMTAGGNEEKIGTAKKILINGVIGLVIILSSFSIAQFIINQLGKATGAISDGKPPQCQNDDYAQANKCQCYDFDCSGEESCKIGLDEKDYFVVKSITPVTKGTGMNNVVIRVIFNKNVAEKFSSEEVFDIKYKTQSVSSSFHFEFFGDGTGRQILEAVSTDEFCLDEETNKNISCLDFGGYRVEVRADLESEEGYLLKEDTGCGTFPVKAEFKVGGKDGSEELSYLDFHGIDGRVHINGTSTADFVDVFSMSFWVYIDEQPGDWANRYIIDNFTGGNPGSGYLINYGKNDNSLNFSVRRDNPTLYEEEEKTDQKSLSYTVEEKKWMHVSTVFAGDSMSMYVDGGLVGDLDLPDNYPLYKNGGKIVFGGEQSEANDEYSFKGKLDEVRIYEKVLSPQEILELSQSRESSNYDGLYAGYHFEEGEGVDVNDLFDGEFHGEISGGVDWIAPDWGRKTIDKDAPEFLDGLSLAGVEDGGFLQSGKTYWASSTIADNSGLGGYNIQLVKDANSEDEEILISYFDGPRIKDGSDAPPEKPFEFLYPIFTSFNIEKKTHYTLILDALDIDSNFSQIIKEYDLLPDHCFNDVKDEDETGVDSGGSCGGDEGDSCAEDWQCSDGNKCVDNICTAWPKILDVDPMHGATGNWVSIFGKNFGSEEGEVYFDTKKSYACSTAIDLEGSPSLGWNLDDDGFDADIIGTGIVEGIKNNAFEFNGVDNILVGPSSNELVVDNADEVSISLWFKTLSIKQGSARGYLASLKSSSLGNVYTTLFSLDFGHAEAGYVGLVSYVGAGNADDGTNHEWLEDNNNDQGYNDDEWHHAVAVLDGDSRKLYVDGGLVGEDDKGMEHVSGNSGEFTVGAFSLKDDGSVDYGFDGQIDEVFVFDSALSEDEVKAMYASVSCDLDYEETEVLLNVVDEEGCGDTWTNNMIIVEVPNDELLPLDYLASIRVRTADDIPKSDSSVDEYGPKLDLFEKDDEELPGLCSIKTVEDPGVEGATAALPKTPVVITGKALGVGNVSRVLYFDVFDVAHGPWSETKIFADVPNLNLFGETAVSAVVDGKKSNSVKFEILDPGGLDPHPTIEKIDPIETTPGSYITISGSGFDGEGRIFIADSSSVAEQCAANPDLSGDCKELDLSGFPEECGNTWEDNQVIAKLPLDTLSGNYFLALRNGLGYYTAGVGVDGIEGEKPLSLLDGEPKPGICKIDPDSGVAPRIGDPIKIHGDNFVSSDGTAEVYFWINSASSTDPSTWMNTSEGDLHPTDGIIQGDITNQKIDTFIPYDNEGVTMESGPIKVGVGDKFSNGVDYTISDCRGASDIEKGSMEVDGYRCCEAEGPDEGRWKSNEFACIGESRDAGYVWRFSTGLIDSRPRVLEQCDVENWNGDGFDEEFPSPTPWTEWPTGNGACINATVAVKFNIAMDTDTVNSSTVKMYSCGVGETPDCDDEDIIEEIDLGELNMSGNTLKIRRIPPQENMATNTWYRVELSEGIMSVAKPNNLGELSSQTYNLQNTGGCVDVDEVNHCIDFGDVSTAYYFEFKTADFDCQMTDAEVDPKTYTTHYLGKLYSPDGVAPNPFYYAVWGFSDQECIALSADIYAWDWETNDSVLDISIDPEDDLPTSTARVSLDALSEHSGVKVEASTGVVEGDGFEKYTIDVLEEIEKPEGLFVTSTDSAAVLEDFEAGDFVKFDNYELKIAYELNEISTSSFKFIDKGADSHWFKYRYIYNNQGVVKIRVIERHYVDGTKTRQFESSELWPGVEEQLTHEYDLTKLDFWKKGSYRIEKKGNNLKIYDLLVGNPYEPVLDVSAVEFDKGQDYISVASLGAQKTAVGTNLFLYGTINEFVIEKENLGEETETVITATNTTTVEVYPPVVIDYGPNCAEACVNSSFWVKFSRPMAQVKYEGNMELNMCETESCVVTSSVKITKSDTSDILVFSANLNSGLLVSSTWYQVLIKGGDDGVRAIGSVSEGVLGKAMEEDFVWKFRTKSDSSPCKVDNVSINPDPFVAQIISQQTKYSAIPRAKPDSCSSLGQELNPWSYGWSWKTGDQEKPVSQKVASVTEFSFGSEMSPYCNLGCVLAGSNLSESIENAYLCGNGTLDPGEDCDIGIATEANSIGTSCTLSCLRPGNSNPLTCGNGDIQINFGEECDPGGDKDEWQYCTENCLNIGSSLEYTSDVGVSWCGSDSVTEGEDCDLKLGLNSLEPNNKNQSSIGCSESCLHLGTPLEQAWCDDNPDYAGECGGAISWCGNEVLESGEECEIIENNILSVLGGIQISFNATENPADYCSSKCLLQDICELADIDDEGLRCNSNEEGCNDDCTLAGSSVEYVEASLCGDGKVETGESGFCEVEGVDMGDGVAVGNAVQRVYALGNGEVIETTLSGKLTMAQYTTIEATVESYFSIENGQSVVKDLDDAKVTGIGDYYIACGYEEYASPEGVGADLTYNQCPFDSTQEQGKNTFGVADNSCCYQRPYRVGSYPADGAGLNGDEPVCPNTLIEFDFNGEIDKNSVEDNFIIAIGHEEDHYQCGEDGLLDISDIINNTIPTIVKAESGGFLENIWNFVKRFFVKVLGGETYASKEDVGNVKVWCASEIGADIDVLNQENIDGQVVTSTIKLYIDSILPKDSYIAVHLKGGNSGITDVRGVGIRNNPDEIFDMLQDSIVFITGSEVCKIDSVEVNPEHHLFSKPNTTHEFEAIAKTKTEQKIVKIAGQYDWELEWQPQDNEIVIIPEVGFSATTSITTFGVRNLEGSLIAVANINITEDSDTEGGSHEGLVFTGLTNIEVNFCENPWPARDDQDNWSPFEDLFYNFSFSYCADDGLSDEKLDDLPFLDNALEFTGNTAEVIGSCLVGNNPCMDDGMCDSGLVIVPGLDQPVGMVSDDFGVCWDTIFNLAYIQSGDNGEENPVFCSSDQNCLDLAGENAICKKDLQKFNNTCQLPEVDKLFAVLSQDTLRRYVFFSDKNDDVFGVQIFKNSAETDEFEAKPINQWYAERFDNLAQMQTITLAGYPGLTDGRNYYVNSLNQTPGGGIYSNVYLFSVNKDAQQNTLQMFEKILNSIEFNINITDHGYCLENGILPENGLPIEDGINSITSVDCVTDFDCRDLYGEPLESTNGVCSNAKTKMFRDLSRLPKIGELQNRIIDPNDLNFPELKSGTFLPGYTVSRWPTSWSTFGVQDEINAWVGCNIDENGDIDDNIDSYTCWNAVSSTYHCPTFSSVYEYKYNVDSGYYMLHGPLEYFEKGSLMVEYFIDEDYYDTEPWCLSEAFDKPIVFSPFGEKCGDGIVNPDEQCDPPGSTVPSQTGIIGENEGTCTDGYNTQTFPIADCSSDLDCGFNYELLDGSIGYTDKNGFCTFGDEPIIDVDKSTLEKKYVFGCDQHSDCLNKNTYANRLEEGNSGLVATSIGGEEFEVGDASFDEYFLMSPAEIGCQVPSNELKEGVVCLGPEIQYQTGACPQGQIAFKSCSNSCEWEYSSCKTTYECGNAVVEQGENCDDGALNGTYGHCADENSFLGQPEKACKKLHPEYCGDGVKNYDENGSPLEFCEPADPTGKKAFIRVPHDSTYYKIADLMVSCPDVWEDGYIYDNYVQFSSLISLAPKQTDLFYGFDYLDKVFLASQNVFNNLFSIIPETVIAIDCEQDSDCNDGNSCNLDKCLANECRYAPLFDPASIPGCCADSADCDDGDINTKDMCLVGSICSYQDKVGNECGHNGDCGGSEACVEGECTEVTFCVLHSDCDDNNPATVDYCQNSICQSVGVECSVNSDCDDGISCTNDVCNNAVCSNINTPGCCNQNSDCSDGNVCTTDTCNLDTNECIYDVSADCCNVDAECDDGILCTEDVCVNHSCHSGYWDGAEIDADPSLSECCNASDKTCASGDYCTEENICAVIEGECMQQGTKEGCGSEYCNIPPGEIFGECVSCIVDSNCNDGKMCTQDSCVNNTCVNQEKLGCLTCNLDSECGDILTGNTYYSGPSDNGECREASCIAGQCRWTVLPNEIVQENGCMLGSLGCNIPGYCANDQEAGDDNKCTQDSCNDNCQIENLPYDQVGWESELNSDPECCYKDEFWKGDHCESGFCNFSSAMCIDEKEALQAFYSKLEDEVKSSCLSFNGVCSGDENIVCNSSVDCLLTSFEYSDPGSLSEFKAIYDTAYSPKGTIELGECVPVSSAYNKDKESSCSWDCQSYGIYCGDGYLQSDYEDCDDGGNENQDGCNSECLKENIACLQAGPFYNIVTTTEPIPIKSSIQITNVGECFTSTGEEICRAAKLDCIEVKILGNQKIDCDVELGDYDQTYNSLVTCAGVFIPVAQSEKEEVLGDKYCGNGVPDGTYDDEESGEEITEVCDLGDNNGIPCLPEYSDSCTYCSSDCEEVLTVDSEAYCGNGEIDLISDEDGFEACEDLSANGYILSNDDSFPFKICDDKGVYLCQNQCLNLVNNCITCGFSNDGNEAYVNLLNVVTGGSDDKVGWPVGNEISSLTFAYSSSEGIVSPTQEDVGTQGVIKSSSDSLLNLTTTGELINTDLACNKESGKSYVIQFSSQESIEPDKMFDFQVKNESEEVINEYAISPPVPEKTFRVVVKWTDENSDVDFSGIVYNEGIGLEKSISPVFLYDDILNDWGLCNDTNYPVGCGDGYSDVGVYMHPVGNLEKTYAQAITIDTNLRGNNSHNYGFVVGQSNVPFSPSVPKPAMQPYHDSNIIVEVYEYRGGDQDELSIYKPNKVFEIKNSKGSGNSSASFWHVFNLIFDEDTEEYEVVAVQEIKTGEENVWEGIPDSAVDYFGSLLSNFGQVDASNLFYQGGAIESLVALDGVTSADFMTILDYPRDVIGSQGSSDNIIFRIIKQNDYWSLANCGIDVSATECYNQSPFGDVYTLLESDVYYQDCPEEEFGCKNVQNVSFITMQEGIPYKFIVSYFYEESGLNQPMKDSLISSSPTDSFEDGIGPHSIKFYFGYQTELGLAIYGGDPNLELDYNDYGLLSDTDDEWHILNVTKTDNDLFIDFKGVLIDHPENNSEYN